jgi:1-deoxy-D-xylulose-5-phosphate synthase
MSLREAGVTTPVQVQSIPQRFLPQGKRGEVLSDIGLTAQEIARQVVESVAGIDALDQPQTVTD